MSIDVKRQIVILIYEYFFQNAARLEKEYIELLERHYSNMFQRFPERYIQDDELLEIINKKVQLEEFLKVQKDIHNLLKFYETAADEKGNIKG